MVRTPCCKAELGLRKGAWTPDEDQQLISYVNRHGEGGWRTLPEKAGLKRCGKSCRLRWTNYLRPDVKRGEFTEDEERSIISLQSLHGNNWAAIARELPGRTNNEIKNYWNTHIKKRLIKKGIDPATHKRLISDDPSKPENLLEIQNIIQTTGTSDDDLGNDKKVKNENKNSGLSSVRFLNRVANGFGKKINQSVLSDIIGSGGPRTTTTTTTSVPFDSESDKSTSFSFAPTSYLLHQMTVNGNGNAMSPPSTMFSDSSFNDHLMYYCGSVDDNDFSNFLNDQHFMMLEESCVENTELLTELASFFSGGCERQRSMNIKAISKKLVTILHE